MSAGTIRGGSVVIVGTGVAGITAAESLRSNGFDGTITVFGDEPQLPYRRTALSKNLVDGDLTDDCVDALGGLEDDGFVLLVTPNLKHELHVDQADVDDAAKTAGLQPQSSVQIDDVWLATKLGRPTRRRG